MNIKTDKPEIRAAANRLKKHLEVLTASTENDLQAAFATMVQHQRRQSHCNARPIFHLSE